MANHKSAIKRIRQNEKSRQRNKAVRSSLRTEIGKFEDAVSEGDVEAATNAFRVAASALDTAASKGVIPRARASRKTGRLHARLHALNS